MYLHSMAVHFAVALFVVAMVCEAITQFTGKRFWKLVTKYQLAASAITALIAVITGFIDYNNIWMTDFGFRNLKTHMVMGVVFFLVVQLMANYRFFIHKMLPPSAFTAYLVIGGVGLGLLFGTARLGKTCVFQYGAGVDIVMVNRHEMEEYLKRLYRLEKLPDPTAEDSLWAFEISPYKDTLYTQTDSAAIDVPDQLEIESEQPEKHLDNDDH